MDLEVTPWLLLSHALIGLLGYVTGMMVIIKSMPAKNRGPHMPHRHLLRGIKSTPTKGYALILALLAVIIALAIQSYAAQRAETREDQCVQQWGAELIHTVEVRSLSSTNVTKRANNRSDRLDDLLIGAIATSEERREGAERSPAEQKDLDYAIEQYQRAVETLRDTVESNDTVREDNPYPVLDC